MDEERRKRMADAAGEGGGGKFPKYEVPAIRFNGNTGQFRRVGLDGEETDLKTPVNIVVLKKRSSLSSFRGATKTLPAESMFTSEYDSVHDEVALFQNLGGKTSFLMNAPVSAIREKHQLLKTSNILYVLFQKEVHKLEVKGGSLGAWFDYLNSLKDDGKHSFEVISSLASEKRKNESLGTTYYSITFEALDKDVDLDVIEAKQQEVAEALAKIEAYSNSRRSASGTTFAAERAEAEEAFNGAGAGVDYPDEEINPEDIPF